MLTCGCDPPARSASGLDRDVRRQDEELDGDELLCSVLGVLREDRARR
jgi:hypothetical protein